MNMKSTGGFTLVELIVVIAILAILAGVAVPAYSGYLKSAEKAGDITALSSVKTGALAALATHGEVTKITVEEKTGGNEIKVTYKTSATETATVTISSENAVGHADFKIYVPDYKTLDLATGAYAEWSSTTGEWEIKDAAPTTGGNTNT